MACWCAFLVFFLGFLILWGLFFAMLLFVGAGGCGVCGFCFCWVFFGGLVCVCVMFLLCVWFVCWCGGLGAWFGRLVDCVVFDCSGGLGFGGVLSACLMFVSVCFLVVWVLVRVFFVVI